MDNNTNDTNNGAMFAFGQTKDEKKKAADSKLEQRRKQFMNEADSEDLKRKRDDKNISLRQDKKKEMFNKRRNLGTVAESTTSEEAKVTDRTYSIQEASDSWQEGMDIMDYFKILAKTDFELPHFIELIQLICQKEDHKLLFGVVGLRKLLSFIDNPPIQNVIDANLLPHLLGLIGRSDFPRLQFEVLWCLTNIASGKADHVQALIDKGAIPIFISLLGSDHKNIVEQAIWALGNIAGEDVYFKNMILKEGAIQPLVTILAQAETDSMLARNCAWCCTNLLRGKPLPDEKDLYLAIPVYCEVLKNNTRKEILTDAMWGISYISDAGEKSIAKILECGASESIVGLLTHKHNNIVLPAIRALGNFVTGEDTETQAVMDAGVLPPLHALLDHDDAAIRKEACWTLSNICAGTTIQVAAVIECGILDKLISLVNTDIYEIQRESGWSVSNATALKNPEVVGEVVKRKGIEAMVKVLSQKVDPKTAVVLLEGIRNILDVGKTNFLDEHGQNPFTIDVEECGGLDIIETLQGHNNQHVYDLAIKILETYFQLEEIDLNEAGNNDIKLEF
jgi:importin subunit alpha-1